MKDLEKIKSEDLGCQVADANPGNFGIEQEVAQLVGATVPAPTEPSADDARELGAQLLVFLRRALLPIRSALRTALAAIYAHLDSRCTDYTPAAYAPYQPLPPYDPMGSLPARTLPNLLTAITAFDSRKISNGGATNDGIPDGMSLARLLGEGSSATKLIDDSPAWDLLTAARKNGIFACLPSLSKVKLNCKRLGGYDYSYQEWFPNTVEDLQMDELERFEGSAYIGFPSVNPNYKVWSFPKLKYSRMSFSHSYNSLDSYVNDWTEEVLLPSCNQLGEYASNICLCNFTALKRLVLGNFYVYGYSYFLVGDVNLIDVEVGASGVLQSYSLNLSGWNPTNVLSDADKTATFLQNFREHIALRLTDQGSGKTLTLSQAVRDAIHAAEATYGIEAIIVTQKGWTLSPAPGASSQ